jgi:elongator complex protein 3
MPRDEKAWLEARRYSPEKIKLARRILEEMRSGSDLHRSLLRNPLPEGGIIAKHVLVAAYRQLVDSGEWQPDGSLLDRIRMKPMRTLSGVTTVTVLTRPAPCPGHCIFCPTESMMPKSYLSDEPGGARAVQNEFDPYRQTASRLDAYEAIGHPIDKIELLILGGSWTAYPIDYQEWFIQRCLDALNGFDSQSLEEAQIANETSEHRNVGLVIETRPDEITPERLAWFRKLGVTKVQLGAQSMDDEILLINQRGHTVAQTLQACAMLRATGFKIVLHWMPNLLGATIESDCEDFTRLWQDACPDEIKIYPTQLLENTVLYQQWLKGEYHPYSTEELIGLIATVKPDIPPYCRVNRIIRDIPSSHVVAGNKRTSLRQDVLAELERRGKKCGCIRCREVRGLQIDPEKLSLVTTVYHPMHSEEHFLEYKTPEGKIAGYLRLSLPKKDVGYLRDASDPEDSLHDRAGLQEMINDLQGAAIIREVHVYGQSLSVGEEREGAAQHIGLGTNLIELAGQTATENGYSKLAVIAAIGTRLYYENRGFLRGSHYLIKPLVSHK